MRDGQDDEIGRSRQPGAGDVDQKVVVAGQPAGCSPRPTPAAGNDAELAGRRGQPIGHRLDRVASCVAALPKTKPNQRRCPHISAILAARFGGPSMTIRPIRERSSSVAVAR